MTAAPQHSRTCSGCSIGQWQPQDYQCESGDAVLTSRSGSPPARRSPERGDRHHLERRVRTEEGHGRGNSECPAIARPPAFRSD